MTTLKDDAEGTATGDEETVDADAKGSATTEIQEEPEAAEVAAKRERRPIAWSRLVAYGVFPGLALLLAVAAAAPSLSVMAVSLGEPMTVVLV